jgi:hypothetical protein
VCVAYSFVRRLLRKYASEFLTKFHISLQKCFVFGVGFLSPWTLFTSLSPLKEKRVLNLKIYSDHTSTLQTFFHSHASNITLLVIHKNFKVHSVVRYLQLRKFMKCPNTQKRH